MKKRSDQSNSLSVSKREKRGYLQVTAILLVVVTLLSSCASSGTEPPPSGVPDGAEQCPGEAGTYTCSGLSDHEITLTGVPDEVLPYLLSVPPGREQELRQAEKEGTECIFSIVGDLAFYDTENNLVTDFSQTPVKITYSFNEKDMADFEVCKDSIVAESVQYVPVYFSDKWRPFPEGTSTVDGNVVVITVTSWGDQPFGGGTQP